MGRNKIKIKTKLKELVTDEPVELEKELVAIQDFWKFTDRF